MKSNQKTYLFAGDIPSKDSKIKEIISSVLSPSSKEFNYDLIYAKDLKSEHLNDIFSRFPVGAKFRVVRVKDIESLPAKAKDELILYLDKPYEHLILILESAAVDLKSQFLKKVLAKVDLSFAADFEREVNVFDLCKAIINKNVALALKLLKDLEVDSGNSPLILGGIIWQWERQKAVLNAQDLAAGFKALYEADKCIKLGKLKPRLALERLILKLAM